MESHHNQINVEVFDFCRRTYKLTEEIKKFMLRTGKTRQTPCESLCFSRKVSEQVFSQHYEFRKSAKVS